VLNEGSILDLDVKASELPPYFGVYVVLVNVVNTAITGVLRTLDVVVLVDLVAPLVFEAGLVELGTEAIEVRDLLENQPTTCDIVHPRQLHFRVPAELPEYRALALVALSYFDFRVSSPLTENRLKRVQNASMSGTPFIDDVKILRGRRTRTDTVASAVDARFRTAGIGTVLSLKLRHRRISFYLRIVGR
jgi:hypothetical protein